MLRFVFCTQFKGGRNYEFWKRRKCFVSKQKCSQKDPLFCNLCNQARCSILHFTRIMMIKTSNLINILNRFKLKLLTKGINRGNLFKCIYNRNCMKRVSESFIIDNQVSLPKIYGKCSQTSFSTQIIQPLRFKDDSKTSRYISHTRLI